ncbi:YceI family protein [Actinoplanes sp. NPDC049118]|uniref:YceI family protein n=1 Tax=Actinoplanes sp. NPDC049118 TaxID=3155769 RepID=UPI003411F6A5
MTPDLETDVRPGTYRIDPRRSTVRFTATHVFGLKPVDGTFTVRAGTLVVAERPEQSTASAELDSASFTTDDKRRDSDVRGRRFLAADTYPVIGFRSTGLARTAGGWRLTGVLGVRGGSAPMVLDVVDAAPAGDGYRFRATALVDRVAAGVTAGRGIIARQVRVTVECCVVPSGAG